MALSCDPHFPAVHLRPAAHWINDPNGLVYFRGQYHVFFQYNPNGSRHADIHWGHARSTDLLQWELLPAALTPTPNGVDRDGVWSGSAVVDNDELVAFYAAKQDELWWQPVVAATSRDGVSFDKYEDILIPEPPPGTVMFRDPYAWRDSERWRMLVGAGLEDGRAAALHYVSDDRRRWTYTGPFLAEFPLTLPGGRTTERGWECVQHASFGASTALVVSAWDPEVGACCTAAFLGTEVEDRLHDVRVEPFDYGPDCYAPALMQAPEGRWLAWGWIWEARDESRVGGVSTWTDEVGWAGMLSVPRELTLTEHGLHQCVARELTELRSSVLVEASVTVPAGSSRLLGEISHAVDIVARLERSVHGVAGGLRIATGADEYLDLYLDADGGDLVVDRSAASRDLRAKGGSWRLPTPCVPGASVAIRAIIDRSVIEVFTETGKALTLRLYPISTDPWQLVAHAVGDQSAVGSVQVSATAWQLDPISVITS